MTENIALGAMVAGARILAIKDSGGDIATAKGKGKGKPGGRKFAISFAIDGKPGASKDVPPMACVESITVLVSTPRRIVSVNLSVTRFM